MGTFLTRLDSFLQKGREREVVGVYWHTPGCQIHIPENRSNEGNTR